MPEPASDRDRARGVLLGLACGDALGRPVEGWTAERIDREHGTLTDFVGGGVHGKPPGTVTDDTQLALREGLAPVPDAVDPDALEPANDAVETLRTACYHALTADAPADAVVGAVNEGGEADTIGAVAGAVAGAQFGAAGLPDRWLSSLEGRDELERLADRLLALEPESDRA